MRARTAQLFPTLFDETGPDDPSLRGVRFALRQGLGLTRREGLGDLRAAEAALGPLRIGQRYLALEGRSTGERGSWVASLLTLAFRRVVPSVGLRAEVVTQRAPRQFWETAGFVRVGRLALPLGVAEQILKALAEDRRDEAERIARHAGVPTVAVATCVDDLRDDVAPDEPS